MINNSQVFQKNKLMKVHTNEVGGEKYFFESMVSSLFDIEYVHTVYLNPIPGESQDRREEPGDGHDSPSLGHGADAPGLEGVDDGVEPLHAHAGQVQHGADHRDILLEQS